MKEYKVIDCERIKLKEVLESDVQLMWKPIQIIYIGEHFSEGICFRMFTIVYEREKEKRSKEKVWKKKNIE